MKNEVVRLLVCAVLPFAAGFGLFWWLARSRRFRTAAALAAVALSWSALLLFVAAKAHAADVVPEVTPEGFSILVTEFPANVDRVCFMREDSPGREPLCRGRTVGRTAQVAVLVTKLEPDSRYCAFVVKGGATSKLSEDCWVGPPSVPATKPVEGK